MILLEFPLVEKDLIESELESNSLEAQVLEKKNFNGQTEVLEVLIALTTTTVPIIAKIIIERIRARKHIEVKHKGIVIKGLSEYNTMKVLDKLIEKDK